MCLFIALLLSLSCYHDYFIHGFPIDFNNAYNNYSSIIKIPLTLHIYEVNPPIIKYYDFQLNYFLDDPVDNIIVFCKQHDLQFYSCQVIVDELRKQLLINDNINHNGNDDDDDKNVLYVRDYYYNQAIIHQHGSNFSSTSRSGVGPSNMYYDTINIDLYYINLQSICISITNAYLSPFNGMDYFYHHTKQRQYMEKICSFYKLATIHCELLYWKLYIKYDINNYKLLTVNEYLDVILPSLAHSEFRMKIPFNDPNANERKNFNSLKSDLCQYYQVKRKSCTILMKDYRDAMNKHYGSPNFYSDGLYDTIFIMDKIEEIISKRGNRIFPSTNDDGNDNNNDMVDDAADDEVVVDVASDVGVHDDIHFIDVDVVEIGTSNFNTIIGFIDVDDPISGDSTINYTFSYII